MKRIARKADNDDIALWHTARQREEDTLREARQIIKRLGISMKLTDVEYQGDNARATFYYTAEQRVDFRDLVRELASTFDIRVDMRQIGARQEAARIGGIGVCGRELCCTSWLKDFRSVSTGAARYQQLSLNPGKLAGQCGKLKCCLNFELDQYVEAVKEFPSPNAKIRTPKGKAVVFKMDIFKRLVYFLQLGEPGASPIAMNVEDANELIAASAKGDVVGSLAAYELEEEPEEVDSTFGNVVGQESLTRFDEAKRKRRRGKTSRKAVEPSQKGRRWCLERPRRTWTQLRRRRLRQGFWRSRCEKAEPRSRPQPPSRRKRKRRGQQTRHLVRLLGGWLIAVGLLAGCGPAPLVAESRDVELEGWASDTPVSFNWNVQDTLLRHDLLLDVRHAQTYPYSNLYVFLTYRFPNGKSRVDTVECTLADERGRWRGSGFGDLVDQRFMLQQGVQFP